jgi:hypothetical protein
MRRRRWAQLWSSLSVSLSRGGMHISHSGYIRDPWFDSAYQSLSEWSEWLENLGRPEAETQPSDSENLVGSQSHE